MTTAIVDDTITNTADAEPDTRPGLGARLWAWVKKHPILAALIVAL